MNDQKKQLDRIENMIMLLFEMQISLMEQIVRTRATKDVDAWNGDMMRKALKKLQKL